MDIDLAHNQLLDRFGHGQDLIQIQRWQQDKELIPAVAVHVFFGTNHGHNPASQLDQQIITRLVTQGIVDQLEFVDVDE